MPDSSPLDATLPAPGPRAPLLDSPVLPERYEDLGCIGRGGMGEVRRVRDRMLERTVAMKILHGGQGEPARRLLAEAVTTARLQHPGIVPVHDRGLLDDGTPWFTMREIQGITFTQVIDALHAGRDAWTLARCIGIFEDVAQAVAYAHDQGVLHRDLKPDNVMIGPFGEVQVVDWGLAAQDTGGRVGSPAWMAPEQVRGLPATRGSDVHALGAMLYFVLSGERAWPGLTVEAVFAAIERGPPAPLRERARGELPLELVELCGRAMAREPSARPSAAELVRAAQDWRDGARKRAQALDAIDDVQTHAQRAADGHRLAGELRSAARSHLGTLGPHATAEDRRPAWELQARADEEDDAATLAEVAYEQGLHAALQLCPGLDEAHEALADLYRNRLERAEREKRRGEAVRSLAQLERHDRGRHAVWIRGRATLDLRSDPPGARVTARRYQLHHHRLELGDTVELGVTPLEGRELPHGSWCLVLDHPDRPSVRLPVRLERCGRFDGLDPEGRPSPVVLPSSIPEDVRYVPAGWFETGGDGDVPDGLPRRQLWVPAFFLARRPVTQAEYLVFLNDLVVRGDGPGAALHRPRRSDDGAQVVLGDDGRYRLGHTADGTPVQPDWPVTLVDWFAASAYASWKADRDGLSWRLPHDHEWEKAARGVDGRLFPWGDHLEPSWTVMSQSHTGVPRLASVSALPDDVSPYGVEGLAGNVRDWCGNTYLATGPEGARLDPFEQRGDPTYRMSRGGAWTSSAPHCQVDARFATLPRRRLHNHGIRLARSLSC